MLRNYERVELGKELLCYVDLNAHLGIEIPQRYFGGSFRWLVGIGAVGEGN